jgi:hypothetical protein
MTPDAVLIQFNLLMMSMIARNMWRIVLNVYINDKGIGASSWYIELSKYKFYQTYSMQ